MSETLEKHEVQVQLLGQERNTREESDKIALKTSKLSDYQTTEV